MTNKIKIAIVGIGNCASSLIQGIYYYKNKDEKDSEYDAYLQETGRRGFEPLDRADFLYYRDFNNIDSVVQDMLEMFGLESIEEV